MRVGLNGLGFLLLYILDEVIHAMLQHLRREVAHDGACLTVQIVEHCVGLPEAEEAEDVVVHLGAQKRHGATNL
jgi:hypothetical protein